MMKISESFDHSVLSLSIKLFMIKKIIISKYITFLCPKCGAFSLSCSLAFSLESIIMASLLVLNFSDCSLEKLACDSTCEIKVK